VNFLADESAVSELIGFILIFGFIIILMSIWQASVVPAENSEIEFDHYTAVQEDMSQLRSDYIDAAETGTTRSTSIQLGTTYPTRVLFVNGPPPRGQIQTEMPSNGTITANGFNVSNVCGLNSSVKTRTTTFKTDYSYFSDSEAPPYKYGNTVLYKQAADGTVHFESDQTLVQGSTLNLYPLTGNISHSGEGAVPIEFMGAETGTTAVSDSISVTIPTTLSDEQWGELLKDEPKFKSAEQVGSQRVKLVLANSSWSVRCAAVGTDQTPSVTPPSDSSSDSPGDDSIQWQSPSNQNGVTCSRPTEECTLDASQADSATLSAAATPTLANTEIDFSTTNLTVASLSQYTGTTNASGVEITDIQAEANGTTRVFLAGLGSTDDIMVHVVNVSNVPSLERLAFTNGNAELFTVKNNSSKTSYGINNARVIGPSNTNIDGDSQNDVPFVNNNRALTIVDQNGDIKTLATDAKKQNSLLAVGQWNGSSNSVFYTRKNAKGIWRATAGSSPEQVHSLSGDPTANAILGIATIDSDSDTELIFAGSGPSGNSNTINYIDDDGTIKHISNSDFGSNNNKGIGAPADFDGDGTATVPIVDGSNNIKLLDSSGPVETITSVSATKAPVATANIDGDTTPEIIYISSGELKYVDDVRTGSPTTGFVRTDDGSTISASDKRGVA